MTHSVRIPLDRRRRKRNVSGNGTSRAGRKLCECRRWQKKVAENVRPSSDDFKRTSARSKKPHGSSKNFQQRRAMFDFADEMTIQIFDHAGLDERERRDVMQTLLDTGKVHDLEYTQYQAMKIVAER
jgi:hypothetical protein